ncbi:MAG: DUF86 domain-containing protein [Deltaproteobacteria bacterium]|nr:MAG: DUF86 domain-containing protein [Deltaproteobacteria bacterium]
MFDKNLVLSILTQIDEALGKIASRAESIRSPEDFTSTPAGMEKLDSICMLFMAIGEALKNIDKITGGALLSQYPDIDWKGTIGFRDIIAHHYFDIDAEQVFWICTHEVMPLSAAIKGMITGLR